MFLGTYKVNERHVEAEIAETVADVPQHDLRSLSYVRQRAVAVNRGAARRPRPRRPDAVVVVVVRLGVEPPSSSSSFSWSFHLVGGGVLTCREVPATDDSGHEHQSRRKTKRDAEVEV